MPRFADPSSFANLVNQLDQTMAKYFEKQYSHFRPIDSWAPPINIYRLKDRLEIVVDLAGVDRERIDIRVEPGRLTIQGCRDAPRPELKPEDTGRVLVMEIDHGPFERMIRLPREVDVHRVDADQRNGLLWIRLPFGPGRKPV